MKRTILIYCFSAIALFFCFTSIDADAQQIRRVLIEEGTNTSCGPCAAQNPSYQLWVNRNLDRVIPIVYHAWWPGKTDVMYLYDTLMNQQRIKYYSMSSVPCGVMGGKYNVPTGNNYVGAVGDTAAWTIGLKAQTFYSPIGITVTLNQTGGTGTVTIDVTSSASFKGKKLRVVICEEHHAYTGAPNKETDFYFLARKMLPDYSGVDITMNANETKQFSYDFSVDASFADDLYAVAYIQDDGTKEVLQTASTLDAPLPKEPAYSVFVNQYDLVFIGASTDSKTMELVLKNTTDNEVTYMLNAFKTATTPADWTATIVDDKYVVKVPAKSFAKVIISLTIGTTTGIGEANLNILIQGQSISFESSKLVGISENISALHVQGGSSNYTAMPIIEQTHGTSNYFNISPQNFGMAFPLLTNLKYIYWDGGTDGKITADDAAIIVDAINNDIGVIITGEQNTPGFVNNGIMALFDASWLTWCKDGYNAPYAVTLAGVPGDFMSKDFGNNVRGNLLGYLLPIFRINNKTTTFPIMTFAKSADSIFAMRTQRPNSRAVFLGINPFVIQDQTICEKLIDRSISYVEYTIVNVDEAENPKAFNATLSPNPVSTSSVLNFSLAKSNKVKISVVNQLGETVKLVSNDMMSEGQHTVNLQLPELADGHYFVVLQTASDKASVHFVKMK
ncbi:MAG: T9SS type A sorting domain-containing protein [Bacteroidota bacterium]